MRSLVSRVAVEVAEIGDKTQLLSLTLAAKYRRPWPICIGIFSRPWSTARLPEASMGCSNWVSARAMQWAVAISFLAMAGWALIPDKVDDGDVDKNAGHGLVVATIATFFLAKMGDKTQLTTMVLAAAYHPLWHVETGTTLGMMVANVPVVWLGARFAGRIPLRAARVTIALLFLGLGLWNLYGLLHATGNT